MPGDNTDHKDVICLPLTRKKRHYGLLLLRGCNRSEHSKLEILSIKLSMHIEKTILYEIVKQLSVIDGLTQVYLRRHLMFLLETEIKRLAHKKKPLSILMIDIDNFKHINDEYGHLVGDHILRKLSGILCSNLRQMDFIGRYGGEEFIIVLPETPINVAEGVAERFRKAVMNSVFEIFHRKHKITISIGIGILKGKQRTVKALVAKADEAMYQAKSTGKNRVVIAGKNILVQLNTATSSLPLCSRA